MTFIDTIRFSINKRITRYRQTRIWAKYGDETRFHFADDDRISIGEFTYGIPKIVRYDNDVRLSIGRYCSIAQDVEILLGGGHHIDYCSTYPFYKRKDIFPNAVGFRDCECEDTIIGNDVWLGKNVLVLGGRKIGNGAIIGAGAVVSKDIPPYAIAVGNPIRVIRYRFTQDVIEQLEQLKWWNWDSETINKRLPDMLRPDFSQHFLQSKSL